MVSICLLHHSWHLRFKKSFLQDIYFLRSSKDFFETDSPRASKRIGSPRFCRQRECFSIVICLNHKTPRQEFDTWGTTARGWGLRVRESSVLVCCSRDRAARDEVRGWLDNPAHCFLQYLLCDIIFSTPQFESYTSSGWKSLVRVWYVCIFKFFSLQYNTLMERRSSFLLQNFQTVLKKTYPFLLSFNLNWCVEKSLFFIFHDENTYYF